MAIQDTFIGNLRAARNIANGMAPIARTTTATPSSSNTQGRVDQPAPMSADEKRRRLDSAWNGTISIDGASDDFSSARQGSRFAYGDRLRGRVTPLQYESFVNNIDNFQNMMNEWVAEDDPLERTNIVNKYSTQYKFNDNVILKDLLDSLAPYDSMDYEAFLNGGKRFTRDRRDQWVGAFKENMEEAKRRYYPYMRV
jgi:hypothetical protein